MPKPQNTRRAKQQKRRQAQTPLLALGVIAMALFALVNWWSAASGDPAAGTTNAIGSQVSANPSDTDIPGLQAAERGAAGKPVLVWFHADW